MSLGDSTTGVQMIQTKVLVSKNQSAYDIMFLAIMLYFTNAAADSGLGESLPNLPKRTESLVSTSSSRLSEDYNFQSPEIGKLLATLMASLYIPGTLIYQSILRKHFIYRKCGTQFFDLLRRLGIHACQGIISSRNLKQLVLVYTRLISS